MNRAVIIGCGYVGRRVAALEQAEAHAVVGVVRSPSSAAALERQGTRAHRADLDQPQTLGGLVVAGAGVYYCAPPPSQGTSDARMEGFLAWLDRLGKPPERIVLISTSGVYGDCGGAWVTEDRPPHPQADRARRRLAAERALLAWSGRTGVAAVILRVPGIYGPGRLPEDRLRRGLPVLRASEAPYSNRVHVDDLARACVAAMIRGRAGGIYNICDGQPTTMTDYFNRVADALGLPRPPTITAQQAAAELSPGMRSYLAESRRLDNRRMREELGVTPRYGDLDRGLVACLET